MEAPVPDREALCYEQHVKELSDKLSCVEKDLRLKEQTLRNKDTGVIQKSLIEQSHRNKDQKSQSKKVPQKVDRNKNQSPLSTSAETKSFKSFFSRNLSNSTNVLHAPTSTSPPVVRQSASKAKSQLSKSTTSLPNRNSWSPDELSAATEQVQFELDLDQNENVMDAKNTKREAITGTKSKREDAMDRKHAREDVGTSRSGKGQSKLSSHSYGKADSGRKVISPRLQRGSSWNAARSAEETKALKKQEVKAETIARIEAFEELLQQKLTF